MNKIKENLMRQLVILKGDFADSFKCVYIYFIYLFISFYFLKNPIYN